MRNIVVFDEDPWLRSQLETLNETLSIKVKYVREGRNMQRMVDQLLGDIIITNTNQLSLNSFLQSIKASHPKLKLLLLQDGLMTDPTNMNVDAILEKPIRDSELLGSISKLIH